MQHKPTPSTHRLPFCPADFGTLTDALDYAAGGETGCNFYSCGELVEALSYRQLRADAIALARKLLSIGARKGDRLALAAETSPYFPRFFFACQYAGLIPVPLPATVKLGSHASLVNQMRSMLMACEASIVVASEEFAPLLQEASSGLQLAKVYTPDTFATLPDADGLPLPEVVPEDTAFIQYTSGSTRFPKGVLITHGAVMNNLAGIAQSAQLAPDDRLMSWLPFYHDMGLVGFMLMPVVAQLSVDYLPTHEFAKRPSQWLTLMSRSRASISFSPCFGFELCARRLRPEEVEKYDLSNWRIAGVGAEMIRLQSLDLFAAKLAPAGFPPDAFLSCYGMAECTLAISFSAPGQGYSTDFVDLDHLYDHQEVVLLNEDQDTRSGRHFVNCGRPLPGFEVEIRGENGEALDDYHTGLIYLRGASIMAGYFRMPEETRETLAQDGWLCTGDIGYMSNGSLTITGRQKDLIIINGRNIWPQDLEYLCETQPGVRVGDAVAFSVNDDAGQEYCVVLIQCRETDTLKRTMLHERVVILLRQELGLDCVVELVPPRSIPVTSSGKRARSRARQNYLDRLRENSTSAREPEQLISDRLAPPAGGLLVQ